MSPQPAAQKRAKSAAIPAASRRLELHLTAFWILPLLWIVLTPPFYEPYRAVERTRAAVKTTATTLNAFRSATKSLPADLNVLRAYARAERMPFTAYDQFGQRLEYLRLDDRHHVLRSFGADGVQNTPTSQPDMGVLSWGPRPRKAPVYKYPSTPEPELYPAVLLEGADSPGRDWLARLYADPTTGKRRLLVRHRERAGLFMAAPHDGVEEFLWLPDGKRVVFTATSSTRHRDGVYVWSLEDDTLVNLLDAAGAALPISPAASGGNLWLTLAGVTASGPTVHLFAAPRHDGPLDPRELFHRDRLLSLIIPGRRGEAAARLLEPGAPGAPPVDTAPPYARKVRPGGRIDATGGGLEIQRTWIKLATRGDLEDVLLSWHEFSEKRYGSVLFPYCLWVLSALYGESYAMLTKTHGRDADVLRTFGTEVARALINHEVAPSYLKNLALFTYESLMEAEPLPYHLAEIKPPPAAPAPAPAPAPPPAATPAPVPAPAPPAPPAREETKDHAITTP